MTGENEEEEMRFRSL